MTLEERIVQLFEEARKVEKQPPRPRFSNASDCLRKHVYEGRAVQEGTWQPWESKPVRWNVAAACGTAIGAMLEKASERLGATTQTWGGLSIPGVGVVSGSSDILWPEDVWDIKCAGEHVWREVQRQPKAEHVLQLQGYCHAHGRATGVLLYIRLASIGKGEHLEWAAHTVEADPSLAQQIVDHWRQVSAHIEAKTLPERPYLSKQWECVNACGWTKECWAEGEA